MTNPTRADRPDNQGNTTYAEPIQLTHLPQFYSKETQDRGLRHSTRHRSTGPGLLRLTLFPEQRKLRAVLLGYSGSELPVDCFPDPHSFQSTSLPALGTTVIDLLSPFRIDLDEALPITSLVSLARTNKSLRLRSWCNRIAFQPRTGNLNVPSPVKIRIVISSEIKIRLKALSVLHL